MSVCFQCEVEVIGSPAFCKNCGVQLRCRQCKHELEKDAKFCSECGSKASEDAVNLNPAVNEFEYDQKGNSKKVKAKFTDNVGVFFASAFNTVIGGSSNFNRNPFQRQLGASSANLNGLSLGNGKDKNEVIQDAILVNEDELSEVLGKVFKDEGGKLVLKDNRLKERSNLDKAKRLVVLFCYARKLMNAEPVTREEINEIISREKLNGGNYRAFMSKEVLKYLSEAEKGSYTILTGGEDFAKEILTQIASPDYIPSKTKGGRKGGKRNPAETSLNGKSSKGSGSTPSAMETGKQLIKEGYFSKAKTLNEIVQYCRDKLAFNYSPQSLGMALNRLVRDKALERGKNKENQYEYWKKS